MECCVCYNNKIMVTTTCKHNILKLRKDLCPYCRTKIDDLPEKIKDIINNNMNNYSIDEEPLVGGGEGELGIYLDAHGTNYFNLSEAVKYLLDELKQIDFETWKQIRDDVNNNNGQFYNEFWLRDLIDSKKNSGFY